MSNNGGRRSEVGGRGSGVGDRDRLDVAIDLAVREMLDVEPPTGLRGRVLDRIDPNSAASAFGLSPSSVVSAFRRKIVWSAFPLAAAAMIILALLAPWQTPAPASVTPASPALAKVEYPPVVAPPAAPKTAEPGTRTVLLPRSSPTTERQPSSRAVENRMVVAAVAPDDNATVIDPLAPITPIVAAGTHPPVIAPKDIAISPMVPIAQLQTAPLSPPERRN